MLRYVDISTIISIILKFVVGLFLNFRNKPTTNFRIIEIIVIISKSKLALFTVSNYIIGHNSHGHYLHAGGLSVNNYVRENKIREVNVRE